MIKEGPAINKSADLMPGGACSICVLGPDSKAMILGQLQRCNHLQMHPTKLPYLVQPSALRNMNLMLKIKVNKYIVRVVPPILPFYMPLVDATLEGKIAGQQHDPPLFLKCINDKLHFTQTYLPPNLNVFVLGKINMLIAE